MESCVSSVKNVVCGEGGHVVTEVVYDGSYECELEAQAPPCRRIREADDIDPSPPAFTSKASSCPPEIIMDGTLEFEVHIAGSPRAATPETTARIVHDGSYECELEAQEPPCRRIRDVVDPPPPAFTSKASSCLAAITADGSVEMFTDGCSSDPYEFPPPMDLSEIDLDGTVEFEIDVAEALAAEQAAVRNAEAACRLSASEHELARGVEGISRSASAAAKHPILTHPILGAIVKSLCLHGCFGEQNAPNVISESPSVMKLEKLAWEAPSVMALVEATPSSMNCLSRTPSAWSMGTQEPAF